MFQPCVQNFLDAMQLGTPHFAHVVKSGVKMGPEIAEARIIDQDSYEHSERRHTDSKGRLDSNIAHHSLL
jgi:hypothetical protein